MASFGNTTMISARDHFREGRLEEAIASAADEVKRHPMDVSRRGSLCELLCMAGDLERADIHLETMAKQDAMAARSVLVFRHLIRAEQARRDFYDRGRPPELLTELTPSMRRRIEASVAIRQGELANAAAILSEVNESQRYEGDCDGHPFTDIRDLDDFLGDVLEVLLHDGRYVWLPLDAVDRLEFHRPEHMIDFLWRRVTIDIRSGPDGEGVVSQNVFVPALYHNSYMHRDPLVRLGRAAVWEETCDDAASLVRGFGQRLFLIGEAAFDMTKVSEVKFRMRNQSEVDVRVKS